MSDNSWTKERIKEMGDDVLKKSKHNLPENLKNIFAKLTVQIHFQSRKLNKRILEAHYKLDGIPMITITSWYESADCSKGQRQRLVNHLSLGIGNWNRLTDNALVVEANLYDYLLQWLSPVQILNIMTDTTQGIKLVKNKYGRYTKMVDLAKRTVKIYQSDMPEKEVANIAMNISNGCLFGNWRIAPQAKWSEHGIIVHGDIPETFRASMSTVADLTDHPSLRQNARITKIKTASKTTRFSTEIDVVTRATIIRKLSGKHLEFSDQHYDYQLIPSS
jgi:hypothetical protein